MDALTASMGINRPSLYSTFGKKHQLFMEAIDRYAMTIGSRSIEALNSEPNIKMAVKAFFSEAIRCSTLKNEPRGCLIANVAMEMAARDVEVRDKIANLLTETDRIVADRLRAAQDDGQLSKQTDPRALARVIVSIPQNLVTRARVGATRKELYVLVDDFTALLFPE